MAASVRIPVLNSLLIIRDASTDDLPEIDGNSAVWSTTSCVVVSCLPDCDGETEVTMGEAVEVGSGGKALFDGRLRTPSRLLIVETVLRKSILELEVPNPDTRVRIWTNGLRDTDKVAIGVE
jgi:hypothetical protein